MADFNVSLLVSRLDVVGGPLADLQLNDATLATYALARGGLRFRTGRVVDDVVVKSEATDYGTHLGSSIQMIQSQLVLYVYGTAAQRQTRKTALERAFSQSAYTIVETREGQTYTAECYPATIVYGNDGAVDEFRERAGAELATLTFLHRPV